MKSITAHARVLNDGNKPVVGVAFNLETFVLKSNRWIRLGSAKTVAKGNWDITVNRNVPQEVHAPMLRLVEAGSPAPRVLAQHSYLKYDATRQLLDVDFGVVERLDQETFKLTAATSQFRRNNYYIAANAQQPQEVMMRMAARFNLSTAGRVEALNVANTDSSVRAKETELLKLRSSETALKSDLVAKDQQISAKEAELARARTAESELKISLAKKEQLVSSKTSELNQLKLQNTNISKTLQQRIKEIEGLRKQQEELQKSTGEGKSTPLSTIATNIGTEVDSANKTLLSRNLPYRFGKIDLNIKGAVAEEGQSITLARISDTATAKVLSNVNLELLPTRSPADLKDAVTVPDISGLTESVVRRLLNSVGLKLEVVSKSLGDSTKVPVGQSIKQSPKSGAVASRNDTVLVVFAAP